MPEGAQLQLAATGLGQLWFSLRPLASDLAAPSEPCYASASHEWLPYDKTLTLSQQDGRRLILCAYVHEYGYMLSETVSAVIHVRSWTQPVSIVQLDPPSDSAAVTVALAGPGGALIWYALEPIGSSVMCEAKAMAARIAPNLTLAADDLWLEAMEEQACPSQHGKFSAKLRQLPPFCVRGRQPHALFCKQPLAIAMQRAEQTKMMAAGANSPGPPRPQETLPYLKQVVATQVQIW